MEHKYNQLSIERYSTNLAKLLCDRYFTNSPAINGQQLISFAPVKQINLFVIKELLLRWNQEMANLKSPFFDFENDEVKDALVQFMNVLSRKILIKRSHFEPLLTKAITDTFLWVLDPAKVFDEKFLKVQDAITSEKLQTHLKYIQINKEFVKRFLDNLPAGVLPSDNILNQFKTFLLRNSQDLTVRIDDLLPQFNELLAVEKSEIIAVPMAPALSKPETPKPEPEPEFNSNPFSETTAPEPVVSALTPPAERPVAPVVPIVTQPVPIPEATPVAAKVETPVIPTPERNGNGNSPEINLNDRFRAEKPNLNDRFAKPTGNNLVESQMGKKIETLKESISINQRFGFINELFNGENMEYYNVIQTLDQFTDAESAKNYVTQDLGSKYNWSKKEEHVNKLLRLIERKFA